MDFDDLPEAPAYRAKVDRHLLGTGTCHQDRVAHLPRKDRQSLDESAPTLEEV
ncbi:hypothetical protein ACQEVB_30110 [Pseudonocardia sp. CA-107938]|uniref:hypothetical protein n=1 Tax=Pseudonocardia sp. CA-107938 TaxID=3240021 RepID=UPI003D8F9F99